MNKYMGWPKSQKMVMIGEEDSMKINTSGEASNGESKQVNSIIIVTVALAKLVEKQKDLADQIIVLCE